MSEHMRPEGLSQGYYCANCGAGGVNMYGSGHGEDKCEANLELVTTLHALNSGDRVEEYPRPEREVLTTFGVYTSHGVLHSQWSGSEKAHEALIQSVGTGGRIMMHIHYIDHTGRLLINKKTVFCGNKWLYPQYDPRSKDPRYAEYLALKKEFEG